MMKNTIKTMLGLSLALAPFSTYAQEAPAPAPAPAATATAPTPEEIKEVVSYYLGYGFARELAEGAPGLTAEDLDKDALYRAVQDAFSGNVDPAMREKAETCLQAFGKQLQDRRAKQGAENKAKGEAFLAENAKKDGVVTTKSGLQYKVLTDSKGRKYDEKTDGQNAVATVAYEGRHIDGTVFDANDSAEFPLNGVVPGFSEALKMMPIGAEWEIYVPSDLAYGEEAPSVIGSNATLIFKMKLIDLKKGAARPAGLQLTPEMLEQLQQQGLGDDEE